MSRVRRLSIGIMTTPKHVSELVSSCGQLSANANADFSGPLVAIKRAAVRARQLAEQSGKYLPPV